MTIAMGKNGNGAIGRTCRVDEAGKGVDRRDLLNAERIAVGRPRGRGQSGFRRGLLAACWLVSHTACGRASEPAPENELSIMLASLDPKLTPLVASRDSMVVVLSRDSGTARADSEFLRFRESFGIAVGATSQAIDDPVLQSVLHPETTPGDQAPAYPETDDAPNPPTPGAMADSVIDYLVSRGIWTYRAEGRARFVVSEAALLNSLGPYLTAPTQAYLSFAAIEQARPSAADASLMISWKELGERVSRLDYLLLRYPDAVVRDLIEARYHWHLRLYLRGADNTPVFRRQSREIEPGVRESYERFVAEHGSTRAGQLIRGYLDVLEKNHFRDGRSVVDFLRQRSGLPEGYLPRR